MDLYPINPTPSLNPYKLLAQSNQAFSSGTLPGLRTSKDLQAAGVRSGSGFRGLRV